MTKEEMLAMIARSGITVQGDLVLEKHVENEIGNVEQGGIGVQIVKGWRQKPKSAEKVNDKAKPQKERQLMTFGMGKGVLDAHVLLLYMKLSGAGWIDGNEADFKRLFSGKNDSGYLTWKGKFGKSTLDYLFRRLIEAGTATLADGFTRSEIIEGHFKDKNGQWLTGLDKGDKPHAKAIPMIEECVSLMGTDPTDLLRQMQGDDSRSDAYDPYDHQDLQLHKR